MKGLTWTIPQSIILVVNGYFMQTACTQQKKVIFKFWYQYLSIGGMMHTNIGTEMFIGQFLINWKHMRAYWRFISGTLWVIMNRGIPAQTCHCDTFILVSCSPLLVWMLWITYIRPFILAKPNRTYVHSIKSEHNALPFSAYEFPHVKHDFGEDERLNLCYVNINFNIA